MTTLIAFLAMCGLNAPTEQQEQLEFIGFSDAEDAAAWRVHVTRTTDSGDVDRYTMIRIIDTKNGQVVGHIRQGRAKRTDSLGRRSKL
ncbi:MAG: hypothetical protein AAFY60_20375, partial [Myxococcota bacterium]